MSSFRLRQHRGWTSSQATPVGVSRRATASFSLAPPRRPRPPCDDWLLMRVRRESVEGDTLPWFERRKSGIASGESPEGGREDRASGGRAARAGDRRRRGPAAAARAVVCPREARPTLAAVARSLRRLGQRGHAPADAGGAGEGVLPAIHGEVSDRPRARHRPRGRRAQALGGPRLLSPRPATACCGSGGGGGSRRGVSADGCRPAGPAGDRPLHRRRHRLDRLRPPRADRGGQLAPRARTARGARRARWRHRRRTDLGARRGGGAAEGRGRLQSGADGLGRDGLHARSAALRRLSAGRRLRRARRRPRRRDSGDGRGPGSETDPRDGRGDAARRPRAPGASRPGRMVGRALGLSPRAARRGG